MRELGRRREESRQSEPPGRVGTSYVALQRDPSGCKSAEWWVAQNMKKVTYSRKN